MRGVREQHEAALLLCAVGERWAAVPLSSVRETMRPLPVVPFREAAPFVLGMAIIRGAPTPVLSLEAFLTGEGPSRAEHASSGARRGRFVLVSAATGRVALAVSEVMGVVRFGADELAALPPLLADAAAETVARLGALDQELLFVLRGASLVPPSLGQVWSSEGGAA